MAQPSPSHVCFQLYSLDDKWTFWNIEILPADSLSSLLERLSKQANINVEEFAFICQFEYGILEGKDLRFFTECKKQILNENSTEDWKRVYANHDSVEAPEDLLPKRLLLANTLVSKFDDVFCSPGLAPVINIEVRCVFFEFDDSGGFVPIPKSTETLLDPQNVAWIEAVRFVDKEGERPILFLQGPYPIFIDMKSGETFDNPVDVMPASRISPQSIRQERCYILLRNKSRLPKWPLSPSIHISIAIRDGVDFSLNDGVIEVKESCSLSPSKRWIFPKWDLVEIPEDSKPHMLRTQIFQYIST